LKDGLEVVFNGNAIANTLPIVALSEVLFNPLDSEHSSKPKGINKV
jgi:hypothetical protein